MLQPVSGGTFEDMQVRIRDASCPAPFAAGLEFNAPVHGTWNIVHIGMLVPECQQIYVCAVNCLRGVILTAAEMNAAERFSSVVLRERDILTGDVERVTIEGTMDVIRRLPKRPPAAALFTVCTHHFLGCSLPRIYDALQREFPDIDFIRGFMDPIMQKEGPTPDQKLRAAMYAVWRPTAARAGTAVLMGGNVSLAPTADICDLCARLGVTLRQMPDCKSYAEYLSLASGSLFLCTVPNGRTALMQTSKRLERTGLYLPMCFGYDEIDRHSAALCAALGQENPVWLPDYLADRRAAAEAALKQTRDALGDMPVMIDYTAHPRPLGLARLLLRHGFRVERVCLNAVSGEEEADFTALRDEAPDLLLCSTVRPAARVMPRGDGRKVLAIGQQAAWRHATPYFVNIVEGGDLYGYDGIVRLCALMREAAAVPKDTRDIVPRKGLGCDSCI